MSSGHTGLIRGLASAKKSAIVIAHCASVFPYAMTVPKIEAESIPDAMRPSLQIYSCSSMLRGIKLDHSWILGTKSCPPCTVPRAGYILAFDDASHALSSSGSVALSSYYIH